MAPDRCRADFLHPIVFAPGVRRTLSIFARPLPTEAALRQIRREKTEAVADSAQKARIGQLADLSDAQEYDDLLDRERSVISGHTDVEFTGLITVTAPTPAALEAATATISRAASQATCELRPLYGHQTAGVHGRCPPAREDHVLMIRREVPRPRRGAPEPAGWGAIRRKVPRPARRGPEQRSMGMRLFGRRRPAGPQRCGEVPVGGRRGGDRWPAGRCPGTSSPASVSPRPPMFPFDPEPRVRRARLVPGGTTTRARRRGSRWRLTIDGS